MLRFLLIVALLAAACGNNSTNHQTGPDLNDGGCYQNPQTHHEIVNGCTTAAHVDKHPVLPLLLPDGGLPDLP